MTIKLLSIVIGGCAVLAGVMAAVIAWRQPVVAGCSAAWLRDQVYRGGKRGWVL